VVLVCRLAISTRINCDFRALDIDQFLCCGACCRSIRGSDRGACSCEQKFDQFVAAIFAGQVQYGLPIDFFLFERFSLLEKTFDRVQVTRSRGCEHLSPLTPIARLHYVVALLKNEDAFLEDAINIDKKVSWQLMERFQNSCSD
jgi:hypothetical protein